MRCDLLNNGINLFSFLFSRKPNRIHRTKDFPNSAFNSLCEGSNNVVFQCSRQTGKALPTELLNPFRTEEGSLNIVLIVKIHLFSVYSSCFN